MTTEADQTATFEVLLEYIKQHRGFDFTGYKRASLGRRINKRMQMVNIDSYQDYLDYLQVQPDEFTHLFNTILINVTRFFRDPASWEYLAEQVIPGILSELRPDQPIRVWNPGCASGEESCTIAILLAEALGLDEYRERVKIYGTDVDEHALSEARQSVYGISTLEMVNDGLREKYFESHNGAYVFHKELRRSVIYGRHDLVQDAPISRIDLLVCRNTLMYLNADTQTKVLSNFHFALNENGALFLGKGEMLLTHTGLFAPIELKQRIFRKVPNRAVRLRSISDYAGITEGQHGGVEAVGWLRDLAFDCSPVAQLVVDAAGNLVLANDRARSQFGIRAVDLGRPFQDFQVSYEPTDLRSKIDTARQSGHTINHDNVRWLSPLGETRYLNVEVTPLLGNDNEIDGFSVTLADISQTKTLQTELERSRQDLETAHEELESTVEEVETTNEELQSTNEELETMNEELQSTNEELETMNEELQSTNEELEAINNELRSRTTELHDANSFLESILTSLRVGVVVVDSDLYIQIWNTRATDLWGLRAEEVIGGHFLNLDIGLPLEQLRGPIRECMSGESDSVQIVVPATNRTGKRIDCKVICTPLAGQVSEIRGVIMIMEAWATAAD